MTPLQPQFVLQTSLSGQGAREHKRSRDSGQQQHSQSHSDQKNGNTWKHRSSEDSSKGQQATVNLASDPLSLQSYSGIQRLEPLRMHSITTADLAAALAPERLLQADPGSAVSNQTHSKEAILKAGKDASKSDPIAIALRRLAFQTAEESSKKLHALSTYAKVRDALTPPALPSLKMLKEQKSLSGDRGQLALNSENKDELEENKFSLSKDASWSLTPNLEQELQVLEQLNSEDQALILSKAFQHIDLAA